MPKGVQERAFNPMSLYDVDDSLAFADKCAAPSSITCRLRVLSRYARSLVRGNTTKQGTGHTWRGHVNKEQNKYKPLGIRGSVLC